jgi:S1-C subfamily serine protease
MLKIAEPMKSILLNIGIAFSSSIFSFLLFVHFYPPAGLGTATSETSTAARLVSTAEPLVNTSPRQSAAPANIDFVSTSKKVTAAVVNINTLSASGYRLSSGSGVIISADGYIITNHHVTTDGSRIEVTFHDKRKQEATIVGNDPATDLALLKVKGENYSFLEYGNSDQVEVGQWVLAVGNPFNLSSTVTAGIVSAKARSINILREAYAVESFIQTDAAVNPGNSGGALVNERGELIGINAAILSESGGFEGYSFAIPSNLARKVVNDLREFGQVQRAILGIGIRDLTPERAGRLSLPAIAGVEITSVSRGSTAAEAGLRAGDVIVSINGTATNSMPELQEQVAQFRPGDRISLELYRDGQKFRRDNVKLKSLAESSAESKR